MDRKILRIIAIAEFIIAVIMYFTVAWQFDNDRTIMRILPHTDFEATLLRLSIYIIPGLNIISGIFGFVFSTDGLTVFTGILELLAGHLTLYFKGRSDLMFTMGIIMNAIGAIIILTVIIRCILEAVHRKKKNKVPRTNRKKKKPLR